MNKTIDILDHMTQPIEEITPSKSIKSRRVSLKIPLKNLHRSSLGQRTMCDKSTERQVKLSQRLLPRLDEKIVFKSKKFVEVQKAHLEQWINNQLDDEQNPIKGQLKAIKKYEIDKKSLLNMQVSSQQIDKLYQTLYVYSHGVKNAFNDLVGKNEQLMIRFWRVYILLLEDKSISTLVEKRHQESLNIVMMTLKATQREVQNLRKQAISRQKQLNKQIILKQDQIKRIKDQKDIIQSNLFLTDEAFNEEVTRRLQFQQKINQINTIHNELKAKHLRLFEQLEVHQRLEKESKESKKSFENENKNLQITISHLQKTVSQLKAKLRQTQQDTSILKTELFQLKQEQLKMTRDDERQYLQLKDVLIREKKVKLQLQNEVESRTKMASLLDQKTNEISRLGSEMDKDRQKIQNQRKKRLQLQGKINSLSKQLDGNQHQLQDLNQHNEILVIRQKQDKKQIKQLKQSLNNQQNLTLFQQRSIQSLQSNVKNLQKMIEQLKQTRLKHQTKAQTLTLQNAKLLQSIKTLNNEQYLLRQNATTLSLKLVQKQTLQTTKQTNMKNQIQISKQKIKSLSTQLTNKQRINADLNARLNRLKESLVQKQFKYNQLLQIYKQLQRQHQVSILNQKSLQSRISMKQKQLQMLKEQLKQICTELLDVKNQDIELNKANASLLFIQQNNEQIKSIEIGTLKQVIDNYRKKIRMTSDQIHPMEYWDLHSQFMRLLQKYKNLEAILIQKNKQSQILEQQSQSIDNEQQINKMKQQYQQKISHLNTLLKQKQHTQKILIKRITDSTQHHQSIIDKYNKLKDEKKVITDKYLLLISKQMCSKQIQTVKVESKLIQIQTDKIQPIVKQVIIQVQVKKKVNKQDKSINTDEIKEEIVKLDSPMKSTGFMLRQESREDTQQNDIIVVQKEEQSIDKKQQKKQQSITKPVTKQQFSRAIKIALLRR